MADRDRSLYAVLIDADNIPADHAEAILKEVTKYGVDALRRVYGDGPRGYAKKDWTSPESVKAKRPSRCGMRATALS